MKPAAFLKETRKMAANMTAIKKHAAFVGLPSEKVGGRIYGDGMSIIRNGAIHEFGYGPIPRRSFLREPFRIKVKTVNDAIAKQFEALSLGKIDSKTALGRIGAIATNISKGAFTTQGYGEWKPDKPATIAAKGSSQTLIDTGTLRGAITWVIR